MVLLTLPQGGYSEGMETNMNSNVTVTVYSNLTEAHQRLGRARLAYEGRWHYVMADRSTLPAWAKGLRDVPGVSWVTGESELGQWIAPTTADEVHNLAMGRLLRDA